MDGVGSGPKDSSAAAAAISGVFGAKSLFYCSELIVGEIISKDSPTSTQISPTSTANSYAPSPNFSLKSYQKYAKFSVAMWDVAMFHVTTINTPPTKEPTQGRRRRRRRRPCVGGGRRPPPFICVFKKGGVLFCCHMKHCHIPHCHICLR